MTESLPISTHCQRALMDKQYDKRKWAAGEIEKTIRKAQASSNYEDIRKCLDYLSDLASSTNPNSRKGGVIGLAALAIGLESDFKQEWIEQVIRPMFSSLDDPDNLVRYYTCEALYNVMKKANIDCLTLFDDIFDKLAKLSADQDTSVRNAADALDKLLKNIIEQSEKGFDITVLIKLLHDRVLVKDMNTKQFIISWVTFLNNKLLNVDMLTYLPALMDGLFTILADTEDDLKRQCEEVLAFFLKKIQQSTARQVQFDQMINLLLIYTDAKFDEVVRHTALNWLNEFLNLSPLSFVPYLAGTLAAIFPCLSLSTKGPITFDENGAIEIANVNAMNNLKSPKHPVLINCDIQGIANNINDDLMQLLTKEQKQFFGDDDAEEIGLSDATISIKDKSITKDDKLIATSKEDSGDCENRSLSHPLVSSNNTSSITADSNHSIYSSSTTVGLGRIVPPVPQDGHSSFCNTMEVLKNSLQDRCSPMAKAAILKWILLLVEELPHRTSQHLEIHLISSIIETLTDQSKEVTTLSLRLLCKMFTSNELNFNRFVEEAQADPQLEIQLPIKLQTIKHVPIFSFCLHKFLRFLFDNTLSTDKQGQCLIRQLCTQLCPEDVYCSFAYLLLSHPNPDFVEQIVQTLNKILLTSNELHSMRTALKELKTRESFSLFCSLYETWCYSPISAISLCFLSRNYCLAYRILGQFGQRDDITAGFLQEIDKLVQLIESPIFAYLRMDLLECERNQDLIKSLYGLLMLLPQSRAFHTLRKRLQCVPNFKLKPKEKLEPSVDPISNFDDTIIDKLLRSFKKIREKHRHFKQAAFMKTSNLTDS